MTHTYTITGMTCENCGVKIKNALEAIPSVTSVVIDNTTATVTMEKHISTEELNQKIQAIGPYTLSKSTAEESPEMAKKKTTLKDLAPLLSLFGIIIAGALAISFIAGGGGSFFMRMIMGLFFVVFGGFKIIKLKGFKNAYQDYDLIAQRVPSYGYIYPFIELGLGVNYLLNVAPLATNAITLVLMLVGALGVYLKLKKKEVILCACLGTVFKVPMTWVTLGENLVMALMALTMLVTLTL